MIREKDLIYEDGQYTPSHFKEEARKGNVHPPVGEKTAMRPYMIYVGRCWYTP